MNNEKILEKVNNIVNLMPEEDKNNYLYCKDQIIKTNKEVSNKRNASISAYLAEIAVAIEENIAKETTKSNRKSSALTAAKRILKNTQKCPYANEEFYYSWVDESKQIICDGYELVILSEADRLPLPELPKNITPTFNYRKQIPSCKKDELRLPKVSELKAAIKIKKAEFSNKKNHDTRTFYDFGKNQPLVDAGYLLNILEIMGDCKAYTTSNAKYILFENENQSQAILCMLIKYSQNTNEKEFRFQMSRIVNL